MLVAEENSNIKSNITSDVQEFTGERFIPGINDVQLEIEHYQRYLSIQKLVQGKVVLDAACGEGYGSNILAKTAEKVVGLDISIDTVNAAKKKYANTENLLFKEGSIAKLPFDNNSIDIVVTFETIEHVSEEIQAEFLNEISRVLRNDGLLIMSTPNKEIYSDMYNYKNEFHIKEFYKQEFIEFLGKKFKNIKLFNQYFEVVSIIDTLENTDKKVNYFKDKEKYTNEGKYYIALASDSDISNISISSVFMNEKTEYDEKNQRIFQLQKEEEIRNNHINKLNIEIDNKNSYILQMQEEQHGYKNLQLELEQKKQDYEIKINENHLLEQKIDELIEDKVELTQEKNRLTLGIDELTLEIDKLTLECKVEEDKIAQLEQEIIIRGEHILKLDNEIYFLREYRTVAELELNSRTYRFALNIRNLSLKILPKYSKRRFIITLILKMLRHPMLMVRIFKSFGIKKSLNTLKQDGTKGLQLQFENTEQKLLSKPAKKDGYSIEEFEKDKKITDYPVLEFSRQDNPDVSIIIPVYNEFNYTYKCLKSILECTKDISYEIIIADDNSTDLTRHIEEIALNINRITNSVNLRFLKNCNNAAEYAKGEYILFLNNDTQVEENWLFYLIETMEKDNKIGLVGPKLIFPDGHLQEAGGIIWRDGSAWNFGNRENPEAAEYNYIKEVDFISGACIMIRKEIWNEIGGFDEQFAPAYYEDVDLAFAVRKRGLKVVYQPLSKVVHFEGISNGTDIANGQKSYQVANQQKFHDKWKETLQKENFDNGTEVYVAKDRSRFRKHILVIDHYVPHFDKDAGGRGTFMYLKLFVEMGMHVTFIGDNFFKHEPYTTLLNQEGIEVLYGGYYLNNYETWIKQNGRHFDYVYLQRPHIAIKYIDIVKKYTSAKIIYYDVDLCHIREMRQYEITKDESLIESAKKWKEIEFELIKKSDVVHVVGTYEEEYLNKEFPNKPIRNIPLYIYSDIKHDVNKNFDQRKNLLFVGGFGHPPNEDAVMWFAKEVFPQVLKKYPDILWYIVGSKPPEKVQQLACKNIIVKGFVADEELDRLYNECRLDIVPLRYGAGVKGKVIEAVYNQIPLITTTIGAEGISETEDAFWIVDDSEEMIDLIINVYEDYEVLKVMSDKCASFIEKNFMIERAKEILYLDIMS